MRRLRQEVWSTTTGRAREPWAALVESPASKSVRRHMLGLDAENPTSSRIGHKVRAEAAARHQRRPLGPQHRRSSDRCTKVRTLSASPTFSPRLRSALVQPQPKQRRSQSALVLPQCAQSRSLPSECSADMQLSSHSSTIAPSFRWKNTPKRRNRASTRNWMLSWQPIAHRTTNRTLTRRAIRGRGEPKEEAGHCDRQAGTGRRVANVDP